MASGDVRDNFNKDKEKGISNGIVHTDYKLAGQFRSINRKILQKKKTN